ncbi:class III signal peptide-containing protein [archaeon]|nr:class III signal peptide-containing protein [archaeon]
MNFRKVFKQENAQTSLEYLLILAGAVVIVVVVGFILKGIAQSGGQRIGEQTT